jgi:hypothetical protein
MKAKDDYCWRTTAPYEKILGHCVLILARSIFYCSGDAFFSGCSRVRRGCLCESTAASVTDSSAGERM